MSEAPSFTLTDLDKPEIGEVLALMIFRTAPIAHVFRHTGESIPCRVEDEQVYVLRWLLKLALEHGPAWREMAAREVERRGDMIRGAKAADA